MDDAGQLAARLEVLESLLTAQVARIDEQARLIDALRSEVGTELPSTPSASPASAALGRRELLGSLGKVAAGAVAGGAAMVVASAAPAAATGTVQGAASGTTHGVEGTTAVSTAAGVSALSTVGGATSPALQAINNAANGLAVKAKADGSSGVAVRGDSAAGNAVVGVSNANGFAGVRGESTGGGVFTALTSGVFGTTGGGDSFGVSGQGGGGGGTGVYGVGTKFGVRARAVAGAPAVPPPFSEAAGLVAEGVGTVAGAPAAGIRATSSVGVGVQATGAAADLHLVPGAAGPSRAHTTGHAVGEVAMESNGTVWVCVVAGAAGQPGAWKRVAFVEDLPPGFDPGTLTGVFSAPPKPGRVYDSRNGDGKLAGGQSRTISVAQTLATPTSPSVEIVPVGASAAVFTLTLDQTEGSGFLSVFPSNVAFPGTSTINWFANGQIIANGGTVTVPADRTVTILAGGAGATHFLLDISGVYT